ncbi:S-adenosyl-L-methionine-dependent methyltransferase MidA [Artemisia annua]|uniref:type II protein arginine methyltransferase n=1 Tax=Artemisia annua TaxID=35608 RepID=A0A2U1P3L9_ARTAN|nr:S-adenosyl-L-methionine-dependent methyltransferase MidA [Artemisia annua]
MVIVGEATLANRIKETCDPRGHDLVFKLLRVPDCYEEEGWFVGGHWSMPTNSNNRNCGHVEFNLDDSTSFDLISVKSNILKGFYQTKNIEHKGSHCKWAQTEELKKLEHVEVCPKAMDLTQSISKRISSDGGGALIIDYGLDGIVSDSLQNMFIWECVAKCVSIVGLSFGFRNHGYVDDKEVMDTMVDSEGWFKTSDLCYSDNECFLFVLDRLKELIKYIKFIREISRIINNSALELLKIQEQSVDVHSFLSALQQLVGSKFAFKVDISHYNIEKELYVYNVEKMTNDEHVISGLLNTIKQIESLYYDPCSVGKDNDTKYQETMEVDIIDNESIDINDNKKLHYKQNGVWITMRSGDFIFEVTDFTTDGCDSGSVVLYG